MTGTLATLTVQLAGLLVAAAMLLGAAVLASSRSVRAALGVFLDLLLAAGLLRLAVASTWDAIAAAAAIVVIRKLAVSSLTRSLPLPRLGPTVRPRR